ncbi:MAG: glycosyltransferase [Myxococcota bacterium]
MIDLSVVIPSFENRSALADCLAALDRARAERPGLAVETIVVDNGSRDGTLELMGGTGPAVRWLPFARNLGFAAAVNRGLCLRRGRHALLLNSDVAIAPDVLARGVALLDARPDLGLLGVELRFPDGRPQRSVHALPGWQTTLLPDPLVAWLRPRAAPRHRRGPRRPLLPGDPGLRAVEAIRGAALFVRGELIERLGLLDESYFFFLEDTEYCRRAAEAGYRVMQAEGSSPRTRSAEQQAARAPRHPHRVRTRARPLSPHPPRAGAGGGRSRSGCGLSAAVGLVVGAPGALVGPRRRARFVRRWGRLLWHLRGRPADPSLADALARGPVPDGVRSHD